MRVPEASGAGLRTAIRLGLPSGNCLSKIFGRRSGARTKSTKGALVHKDNLYGAAVGLGWSQDGTDVGPRRCHGDTAADENRVYGMCRSQKRLPPSAS
jgi:hypothetical protein